MGNRQKIKRRIKTEMKETTNEKTIYSAEFDFAKGTIELEAVWDKEKLERLLHDTNVVQKYRYFIWRNDEENKLTFWFAVPEYPYNFERGKAETCMKIIALSKAAMFAAKDIEERFWRGATGGLGRDNPHVDCKAVADRYSDYGDKLPEMVEKKAEEFGDIVWNMVW